MELVVNRTGREIILLCDGTRTLQEIVDEMKIRYPKVEEKVLKNDIYKCLANFSRLCIIEWRNGNNPFLYCKEEPINSHISLRIGQEDDLRNILTFIETVNSSAFPRENYFIYISPFYTPKEYGEVALRQKLFSFIEEFFLLLKDGEIFGLLSIEIPSLPNNRAAKIKLIACPRDYFLNLLKYSEDNFPFLSVRDITKIRIYELLGEPHFGELREVLLKNHYKEEGVLLDEFGFGQNARIYAKCYESEFIKKINSLKKGGD